MPIGVSGDLSGTPPVVFGPRPGLRVSDASAAVLKGAFWACLHPLSLMRAQFDAVDSCSSTSFEVWTPTGTADAAFVMPMMPNVARLLWHDVLWPDPKDVAYVVLEKNGHKYKPGDVVISPDGRLWFVGPDTRDTQIQVLADWAVDEHSILMGNVYQSGPPKPGERTRFERIANAKGSDSV